MTVCGFFACKMGWIQKILGTVRAGSPSPIDDFWYRPAQLGTAGQTVTADTALQSSAVLACVVLLSETVASLPLPIYRRQPDGGKAREPDHPLADILSRRPNTYMSAFELRQLMMQHLLLRGNAYAVIVPGARGSVDQLIPLAPDRMTVTGSDEGLVYTYRDSAGTDLTYTQGEIFHLRGPMLSDGGMVGLSVIDYARETIGGALAAQAYGNRFYQNDARPGVVLTHPGQLGAEPG